MRGYNSLYEFRTYIICVPLLYLGYIINNLILSLTEKENIRFGLDKSR